MRWLLRLLAYDTILVAFDVDGTGKRYAAELLRQTRRAHRAEVPQGDDLTAFWRLGGDLRS